VKLLANNGPTRWFQAPDVPPVAEVIPGYDLATIVGMYARPGIPQPILDKIAAEAIAAVNTPEAKKQLTAAGIEPTGGNAAAFDSALKREIENVTAVVKSAGIEPQ
jgi:tripartite-type tricarboxylate transporter receptor subunit TctC